MQTRGNQRTPPIVIPRSGWVEDETLRTSDRTFAPIQKLIVHHSATPLSADPTADIRNIYKFHIEGRDWADIAYNFVIDQGGRIYEGRWAHDYADGEVHSGETTDGLGVVGAHTLNYNTGSCGIILLGDFTEDAAERRVVDRRDSRARVEGGPKGHRRVGRRSVHELHRADVGVPEHHRSP